MDDRKSSILSTVYSRARVFLALNELFLVQVWIDFSGKAETSTINGRTFHVDAMGT